jgi:UDP-glucose 4-epimerase
MRILVTGGAGFIGSHIVDRLLADGHTVCVVDDLSTGFADNVPKAAVFKQLDICDAALLQDAFASFKPEVVFHLAAQMDVRRSVREPDFDARVNVLGALNVLRSAVGVHARRFVYAATGGAVYGNPAKLPVTEAHLPDPVSEYGASKLAFEHYLSVYGNRGQIEYAALRFPNVFGPRQRPDGEAGVVAIFTGQMLRGEQSRIFGDGKKTRDYLYVSDIVEANIRAMSGPSGVVANLGWGREVTDLEVFETVAAATGYRNPPVYAPERPGEVQRICLDATLARETWGWRPSVTLREGVDRVVEYVRRTSAARG